ncbi:hypothetical protein GEMRC1_014164 [Eukaryota sp. GEM-RC1]
MFGQGSAIFIQTDQPSYSGGDTVTGHIYVQSNGLNANAVVLEIHGVETANFIERRTEWYDRPDGTRDSREIVIEHSGGREFFSDQLVIYRMSGLAPGNYCYPFRYTLPTGLPGVINITGSKFGESYDAHISYRFRATLAVPGLFFKHDLYAETYLLVNERFDENVSPACEQGERRVLLCCCIPKGRVMGKAYFEDRSFTAGSHVNVYLEFQNQSSRDVRAFDVKLVRHLTLRSSTGHNETFHETVAKDTYDGCTSGDAVSRPVPINLPAKLAPSTDSMYISCKYTLIVEACIPLCPDLVIRLNCIIKPPQSLYAPPPPPSEHPMAASRSPKGSSIISKLEISLKLFMKLPVLPLT